MLHRRRLVLAGLAPLLAAAIAACGSQATDSPSGGSSAKSGQTLETLRMAMKIEPRSFNALRESDSQDMINRNVLETLVGRDADSQLQPLLAESWENDGDTWTFKLRQGVKFHDGSDFTAEDVEASYKRALDKKEASSIRDSFLGGVTAVKAVDDFTFSITSESADPTIPSKATMVMVTSAEYAAPGDNRLENSMMGTGPYTFVEWKRGQEIKLTRNDAYWGDPGKFKDIHITFRPEDSVRVDALKSGEIDLAMQLPADLAAQLPNVASAPFSEVSFLRFRSLEGYPLHDPRVREAINLAIDRQGLIEGIYSGQADSTNGMVVIPQAAGTNPNLQDFPYDPERAKQLVQESGVAAKPLTIALSTSYFPRDREVGQAVVDMLQKAGFNLKPTFYGDQAKVKELWFAIKDNPDQAPDMAIINTSNDLLDSSHFFALFSKCGAVLSGVCDKQFDAIIDDAAKQVDVDARNAGYAKAWEYMHQNFYEAPLTIPYQHHGMAEGLKWTPRPQIHVYFDEIEVG